MLLVEILKTTCKNCGQNHFLYNNEYQCYTCKKVICKSCSCSLDKYLYNNTTGRECFACYRIKDKAIRKMIAVENGIIKDYNIVGECNSITHSPFFSDPDLAIEHLKHDALIYGYSAITYLKIKKFHLNPKEIADFSGSKFRVYASAIGYSASGIPVVIEKTILNK